MTAVENKTPIRAGAYLTNLLAGLIPLFAIVWALQIAPSLGYALFKEQFLAVMLGLSLGVAFLTLPAKRVSETRGRTAPIPFYDWGLAILGAGSLFYLAYDYRRFQIEFPLATMEMLAIGTIIFLLTMEALRRATGLVLFVIVFCFMGYALIGDLVPAPLTGRSVDLKSLIPYLGFDPNAALGTPMSVAATIVVLFIFFGRLLLKTGCGEFFIDLAMAGMGQRRGGAAKISVLASALFGSISGSAISNVATTGVITIPLMRRSGYSGVQSGAIETIASTGGQLMPPIMGAAAFLMAEFLEIPYTEVVIAAIVPALLYYFAVFIQVDLMAGRADIKILDTEIPSFWEVLKLGWHFLIPFAVLLYALFVSGVEAEIAALYGAVAIVAVGILRRYKEHHLNLKDLPAVFWDTGRAMLDLFVIVAAAGFVIGMLNISSGGFALTLFLVQLGGDSFLLLLVISAGVCILLGMGMPTSGVYVLLAALVAPALIEVGIQPLSAHMFILYFGMMSMVTPPIALAAFAAATITGANPMRTGFEAMKLGWVAYIVPVLFVLSPTLILAGPTGAVAIDIITAIGGVYMVSVAVVGHFQNNLSPVYRAVLAALGLCAMLPEALLGSGNIAGFGAIGAGVLMLGRDYAVAWRSRSADRTGG